jgi:hypothetical protein
LARRSHAASVTKTGADPIPGCHIRPIPAGIPFIAGPYEFQTLSRRQRQKMQQIPNQGRDDGGAGYGQDPGPHDAVGHAPPDGRQLGGRTHPNDGTRNGVGG